MNAHKISTIRGIVQIMAFGIFLIGISNALGIIWESADKVSAVKVQMSMPGAVVAILTGTCISLMTWQPRSKTKWFRREDENHKETKPPTES